MFDGLASIHRAEAESWFDSDRLYWFDRRKVKIEEVRVPARTLDSYDFAPALLKLNVERGEIEVLKGAARTLEQHRPVILSAYPWEGLILKLAEFGYRPYAYQAGRFTAEKLGRRFTWFLLEEHASAISLVPNDPSSTGGAAS